jgi:hypothetical protein
MANFYVVILLLERSQFLPEQFSGKAAKLLTVKEKKKNKNLGGRFSPALAGGEEELLLDVVKL